MSSSKNCALPVSSQGNQDNVEAIMARISESKPFPVSGDLADAFRGTTASREDQRGILECHTISKQKL